MIESRWVTDTSGVLTELWLDRSRPLALPSYLNEKCPGAMQPKSTMLDELRPLGLPAFPAWRAPREWFESW